MMNNRKFLIGLVLLAALAGVWLWKSPDSPLAPKKPDRPVLHAIVRLSRYAARLGLWIALCGEDQSSQPQMAHAKIGEDGSPTIDNGSCW
jgi:hypothetical protein